MGGKRFDEQDGLTRDERLRRLARELGRSSPAFERLARTVKQDPELSALMEAETVTSENLSKRRGERRTRSREEPRPQRMRHIHVSPSDRLRKLESLLPLVTDYANGLTQVQIAEKHGLHVQTVRKRLVQAGVNTRAHLRVLTDDDLRQARKAMKEGASAREIARGLGVAHTTLLRALERVDGPLMSPSRTTATDDSGTGSPSRTSRKSGPDQRKHIKWFGPSIEMLGPILGWTTGLEPATAGTTSRSSTN